MCKAGRFASFFARSALYWGQKEAKSHATGKTQWTTIFWEGWTALALCAAAVFWPGSAALGYPAVLWPGLALAAAVPVLWAGWWLWAEKAPPLPEEELMAKPGRIHIVTEEALL